VLRFGAGCCKVYKTDFKSPAYAIPPPGPGMAKLSYQITYGNMSRMELALRIGLVEIECDGCGEFRGKNRSGASVKFAFRAAPLVYLSNTDLSACAAASLRSA